MKSQHRKINVAIILIMIAANLGFAYFYNASVSKSVAKASYTDFQFLQHQNALIIEELCEQDDISAWNDIINAYDETIYIFDKDNHIVAKSEDAKESPIDVKVRTPFNYEGEVYLLRSSLYFLRGYISDARGMIQFVFIELLIGITALFIFILIIYSVMLRPFRLVYRAIEEYDRSGTLMDIKLKGFAGKVYRRFAVMAKNAEGQQQNQRRIIASISHDIKTPLTSIMGYSERLKKEGLSAERRERYLETVYEKAVDIRTLVDEFDEYLGYNLPYEMKKLRLSVREIKDCLIKDYADDLSFSGIDFEINNYADPDTQLLVDTQKLKRVCSNILTNSIKHLKKDEKKIRVDIFSDKEMIKIKFSDNGEGVAEDKLQLIFEPLYTSDEGRKVAGLGLSICREIVEAHDGRIYAEKSELGGLAVSVELPRG